MTMRNTFGTTASGAQRPGVDLDNNFNDMGQLMGITQCSATGTNAITLTPAANQPNVSTPLPANQQMFSFVAAATSTGSVTAQVGSGSFVPIFLPGGTVQAGTNNILQSSAYVVMFLTALNSGAGGFMILSAQSGATVLRGYLGGLNLSNDGGSPNTVLDISAGQAADSTNSITITLGAFTKTTGGVWVAGTGNAGMGTGLTIANTTWYHVFAIINGGVSDVYFDTSVTAANKPAGTSVFRRIGSFLTDGSAHITLFFQNGDDFLWSTMPALDVNTANPGTSAVLATLAGVPLGVRTRALLNTSISNTTPVALALLYSSPDVADTAPSQTASPLGNGDVQVAAAASTSIMQVQVWTNTTPQIRYRASASDAGVVVRVQVAGWTDYRGRFS